MLSEVCLICTDVLSHLNIVYLNLFQFQSLVLHHLPHLFKNLLLLFNFLLDDSVFIKNFGGISLTSYTFIDWNLCFRPVGLIIDHAHNEFHGIGCPHFVWEVIKVVGKEFELRVFVCWFDFVVTLVLHWTIFQVYFGGVVRVELTLFYGCVCVLHLLFESKTFLI